MTPAAHVSVVVAGFEPFDGRRRNRSWEAVRRLPVQSGRVIEQLPVDFAELPARVSQLLALEPRALLLVGEARRPLVSVEQLALNVLDAERTDNRGRMPRDEAVVVDGPLVRRVSWEARTVVHRLAAAGIRAEVSFHAGTFACNLSLYVALALAEQRGARTAVGFLHVPARPWPFGPRSATLMQAVDLAAGALLAVSPLG